MAAPDADVIAALLDMVVQASAVLAKAHVNDVKGASASGGRVFFSGGFVSANPLARAALARSLRALGCEALFFRHSDFLGRWARWHARGLVARMPSGAIGRPVQRTRRLSSTLKCRQSLRHPSHRLHATLIAAANDRNRQSPSRGGADGAVWSPHSGPTAALRRRRRPPSPPHPIAAPSRRRLRRKEGRRRLIRRHH